MANWLLGDIGLAAGDRAMLVYAPGPEFFVAFIACLRVGVLAVPNSPPDPSKLGRGLYKLNLVTQSCDAAVGLVDDIVFGLRTATRLLHSARPVPLTSATSTRVARRTSFVAPAGQRCAPSILREFAGYFGTRCNLPAGRDNCDIFSPTYGLAQHVAPTCGEAKGIYASRRRPDLASRGSEFRIDVRIVDVDTRRVVPDGSPGEVWLSSESVARGYWGKPELGVESTGDEAFVEDGRRLFVCERIKDMIIIGGDNYYSDDVEIAATPSVREAVGLSPRRIVFIKQKTILKTTSGKLRRRAIRDALLAGELRVVFDSNPTLGKKQQQYQRNESAEATGDAKVATGTFAGWFDSVRRIVGYCVDAEECTLEESCAAADSSLLAQPSNDDAEDSRSYATGPSLAVQSCADDQEEEEEEEEEAVC
ncbi:hypothetical protein CTAYLR_000592 [Chrysophaeum taylorii]|uniref:AMP-dependent synthetase/ligase domain-containing protein n=1 Tax=Chrysophaeum taylorii TaxID=2483200 RepID=A0AAD7XMA6_9STRA|nr:hypothetical protein CTAYLR_000592 [Chrysophaeum taylorii]